MERISIGRLARHAGVKISTVRVYERHGLLAEPARSDAGYREYVSADLDRLVFIRRAKELGFTLSEIRELLGLFDDPDTGCADVLAQAEEKLAMLGSVGGPPCPRLLALPPGHRGLRGRHMPGTISRAPPVPALGRYRSHGCRPPAAPGRRMKESRMFLDPATFELQVQRVEEGKAP